MPSSDTLPVWQRSFIALAPDDAARDALARIPVPAPLRPLQRADLHLTLAFLGGLSPEQRTRLEHELAGLPAGVPPLRGAGLVYWPNASRVRVLVATFESNDAISNLLAQIKLKLPDLGLPVEHRPFRPHITLARPARGKPAQASSLPSAEAPRTAGFAGLGLYARSDTPGALRYQTLWYRSATT